MTFVDEAISRFIRKILARHLKKGGEIGAKNQTHREAWLERALAALPSGSRILDAGAGELQYKRYCRHLDYVSQDFARYDGRGNGKGLQSGTWDQTSLDIVSDICSIPQPDASFDAVMCVEVLEHVPRPVAALRELNRLLKRGGVLIVTAPFCSLTHMAPHFYHTGYSKYFYEHWLDQLGFEIVDMQFNGNYFEYLGQELRRLPWVADKYANGSLDRFEQLALEVLLGALNGFSQKDQGSEQFLAYGLHVLACKK